MPWPAQWHDLSSLGSFPQGRAFQVDTCSIVQAVHGPCLQHGPAFSSSGILGSAFLTA